MSSTQQPDDAGWASVERNLKQRMEMAELAYNGVKHEKRNKDGVFSESKRQAVEERDKAKKAYNQHLTLKVKRELVAQKLGFSNTKDTALMIDEDDDTPGVPPVSNKRPREDEPVPGDDAPATTSLGNREMGKGKAKRTRGNRLSEDQQTVQAGHDEEPMDDRIPTNRGTLTSSANSEGDSEISVGRNIIIDEPATEDQDAEGDTDLEASHNESNVAGKPMDVVEERDGGKVSKVDDAAEFEAGLPVSVDVDDRIPIPDNIKDFKYVYRRVDWNIRPPFENSGKWSDKELKIRRQFYQAEYEFGYATRQRDQLQALQDDLAAKLDRGEMKPSEMMEASAEIVNALRIAQSWIRKHNVDLKNAREDIRVIERDRQSGEEIPGMLAEVNRLYVQMVTSKDEDMVAMRVKVNKAADKLDISMQYMPVKKMKFPSVPQDMLDQIMPRCRQRLVDDSAPAGMFAAPKKVKSEPKKWDELSAEEREELDEGTQDVLDKYLGASTPGKRESALKEFDGVIPRYCVEVQEFFPESSYTSRELALHVHTTQWNNLQCRYHHQHRSRRDHDTITKFYGVAFPRNLATSLKDPVTAKEDHMHCGCAIDDVLFEYFCWKNTALFSTNPALRTRAFFLDETQNMAPVFRSYMVKAVKEYTGLTVNDFFTTESFSAKDYENYILKKVINHLSAKVNKLGLAVVTVKFSKPVIKERGGKDGAGKKIGNGEEHDQD